MQVLQDLFAGFTIALLVTAPSLEAGELPGFDRPIVRTTTKPQKPVLYVWTSPDCPPCASFWPAVGLRYQGRQLVEGPVGDPDFLAALLERFSQVSPIAWEQNRLFAWSIDALPTFVVGSAAGGGVRVEGYRGKEWLAAQLGLRYPRPQQRPQQPPQGNPPPNRPAPTEDTGNADPIKTPPVDLTPLESSISALGDRLNAVEGLGDRIDAVRDLLAQQTTAPVPPVAADQKPQPDAPEPRPAIKAVKDVATRLLPFLPAWAERVALIGTISAPPVALGLFGLQMLLAIRRRRRDRAAGQPPPRPPADAPSAAPGGGCCPPFPRHLDEARELLALRQSEGRVAPLDALRGMVVDDELSRLIETNDPRAPFARELKDLLDDRVNEIAPVKTGG